MLERWRGGNVPEGNGVVDRSVCRSCGALSVVEDRGGWKCEGCGRRYRPLWQKIAAEGGNNGSGQPMSADKREQMLDLIREGRSARSIARSIGSGINTVIELRRALIAAGESILCPCGLRADHRQPCAERRGS